MTAASYYEPLEQPDDTLRLCVLCGEDYPADDLCPCLPVEPPCEDYDVWGDR